MRIFNADETIFTSNGLKSLQPIYCHEIRNESEWYLDVRVPLSFLEHTTQDNIIVVETLDKGEQAFRIRNIIVGQDIKFEAWHIGYDSRVFTVTLSTFVNLNPTQALTQLLTDTQANNFTVFSNIATQLSFSIINVPLYDALIDMAKRYNAVLEFDNWQIRLVSSIGSDKGVTVAYGKNLESSSFEENWDMVVTELYPKGNNGLVGTTLYSSIVYDRPYAKIVSFDTDDLTTLNNLASAYLSRFEKPRVNYKVKASNLSYLENVTGHNALSYFSHLFLENYNHNELSDFKYPTLVGLGDTIKVVAKQFELFTDVLSYKFNVITRKMIELEFGNYRPTIRNAIGQLRAEVVEQSRNITQLKIDEVNGEISTLVTDGTALASRVSTAETSITQQANAIALKADQTTVDGINTRLNTAEQLITPTAITSTVRSSTEYINDLGAKENTVFKQNTAPTHLDGRLWLNTSVTPNVLNRSNGTAWVRATPTQASEVGAYSSGQVDTILTSYSTIDQTADKVEIEIGKVQIGGKNELTNALRLGTYKMIGSGIIDLNHNDCPNGFYIVGDSNTSTVFRMPNVITSNGWWTLSFDIRGSQSLPVSVLIDITDTLPNAKLSTNSNNTWMRVSMSVNVTNHSSTHHFVDFIPDWAFIFIKDIKIEKGNKATEFTHANNEMRTAKYTFDGSKARFYGDGQEWYDSSGNLKVSFDTVNNRFVFKGQVEADTGLIGRFAISGQDLVYTSELFDKDYDRSDVIKLHRILLGFEPQTPYDLWVYDVDNSGTLNITDLTLIDAFVQGIGSLPTPRKRIRSVVRIGTNNGALTTQAVAENGSVGPTTTIRGEKITGDLLSVNGLYANTSNIKRLEVTDLVFTNKGTLSDYQEGTWTPTIVGSTVQGVGTYTNQVGQYTKIGNKVTCIINIAWTAHTGTGNPFITLPFTAEAGIIAVGSIMADNLTFTGQLAFGVIGGSALAHIWRFPSAGLISNIAFDTSATVYATLTYTV